jgi:hypothetical protein
MARFSGQLRQRVGEYQPVHGGVDVLGRGAIGPHRVRGADLFREARAALLVDDHVAGDGEKPRPCGWRRGTGDFGFSSGTQHGFLHDLRCPGAITSEQQGVTAQRGRMLAVDPPQLAGIRTVHPALPPENTLYLASSPDPTTATR